MILLISTYCYLLGKFHCDPSQLKMFSILQQDLVTGCSVPVIVPHDPHQHIDFVQFFLEPESFSQYLRNSWGSGFFLTLESGSWESVEVQGLFICCGLFSWFIVHAVDCKNPVSVPLQDVLRHLSCLRAFYDESLIPEILQVNLRWSRRYKICWIILYDYMIKFENHFFHESWAVSNCWWRLNN